jgi:hypothetical protein
MCNTTTENFIVVDVTTRAISIPESEVNFGVAGDKNVETRHIRINGHVTASGLDLSQNFVWRVVGNNGGGGPFSDPIDTTTLTSDGCIEMDWTPSPAAMARKGKLHFNVCGIEVNDSGISLHEWHSEMGTGIAKENAEAPIEDIGGADLVAHLQSMAAQVANNAKVTADATAEVKIAAEQVEQGKNTTLEAVESIIDSAKEASDAAATSAAARDVAKKAQNAATQQATQAAQSKDAADKLMQQAKTYADEAAGYAGAAKYSFGYTSDGRFAFFVNDESEV